MISNELLEEVIYLSDKDKNLDKKILQKALNDIMIEYPKEMKQKFKGLRFKKIDKNMVATGMYDPRINQIIFDLDQMYIESKERQKLGKLFCNLEILTNIYHELEHFKEQFKIENDDFEAKLLRSSILTDEKQYEELYKYIPSEKLAYVNSWNLVLQNILNYPEFKSKYFETYRLINNEYINFLKLGYYYSEFAEKYNVPLFYFLGQTDQLKLLSELIILKKYGDKKTISLENKFKYGLPIKKEDVEELNKRKILIKKY